MSNINDKTPDAAAGPETDSIASSPDGTPVAPKGAGKAVWMGTAVGIGSAAIVAALLYTRKRS